MLQDALQAALKAPPSLPPPEPALLLGGGGWLGAAFLAQLSHGAHARVGVWVVQALGSTHRGVWGVRRDDFASGAWHHACAYVVLEREGSAPARDAVFAMPKPQDLLPLSEQLKAAGVRRLVVVLPHLPGSLPEALQHGFADETEQQLAALGFAQLLLVRSSREGVAAGGSWVQRLANAWWAQLRWMLPDAERPLRSVALARVVLAASHLLRERGEGVHILSQPLASRAAHAPEGIDAFLRHHWLGE